LGGKVLEITKEIVPRLTRIAVIAPPGSAVRFFMKETEAPARALKIQLVNVVVRGPDDYENVLRAASNEHVQAVLSRLGPSPSGADRTKFMSLAAQKRLPVASQGTDDAEAGALLAYGREVSAQYRRVAVFVDKILKGAKPAELPVEAPTKFELVVNLKTANEIGLTIPQRVLLKADRVIK